MSEGRRLAEGSEMARSLKKGRQSQYWLERNERVDDSRNGARERCGMTPDGEADLWRLM